jgi:hypothetical protein
MQQRVGDNCDELRRMWKGFAVTCMKHHPSFGLESLKNYVNLSQDCQLPRRELNPRFPKEETQVAAKLRDLHKVKRG